MTLGTNSINRNQVIRMNEVFKWCVELLELYAKRWDMTYEELNVWIFCIIEPIVFFIMLFMIIKQYIKIHRLQNRMQKE